MNTKILGNIGEAHAEAYLKKQGYKILERNFKNRIGEIDLIAEKGDVITFVEVKSRSSNKFGMPKDAVNFHKQFKIKKVAESYLLSAKKYYSKVSFDVIEYMPEEEIVHLKNCFWKFKKVLAK